MDTAKEKNYLFSIIMAIYNVEEYLEEAIESVINQTLDFRNHVQLILINDGSPDHSEQICLRYKEKYPENIVYIAKENGGVSSARNKGLELAQGKYINFLDPDDKFSEGTLEDVFCFFESNYEEIDVVAIPMYFFEAYSGEHILNNKFKSTRIIDLNQEYDKILLSASSSFIKYEAIEDRKFDEKLKFVEDSEFVNKILLNKNKLGVVSSSQYYYRKRWAGNSAVQGSTSCPEWYTQSLINYSLNLINYCANIFGYVPKYIQYLLMYDLQWKFNVKHIENGVLSEEEYKNFFLKLKEVLSYIEDSIILEQKHMDIHRKLFALKIKYSIQNFSSITKKVATRNDLLVWFKGNQITSVVKSPVYIDFIDIIEKKHKQLLHIEGTFGSVFYIDEIKLIAKVNGEIINTSYIKRPSKDVYSLNCLIKEYYGFNIDIPIESAKNEVKFYYQYDEKEYELKLIPLKHTKLSNFNNSYKISNFYKIQIVGSQINIIKATHFVRLTSEYNFLFELIKSNAPGTKKAIIVRLFFWMLKLLKRKPIWLYFDRLDKADDNAEHLYKYAINQPDKIKHYFVIKKDSPDYNRIGLYGKVIKYGSFRHKINLLLSEKLISSHVDEMSINPFKGMEVYYRDLFQYKFVFLQHGITKDDMSKWLNKYNKNIEKFVTASYFEFDSIINGNYGYNKNNIVLTGFPRYDNLSNDNKKQILISPTWRSYLVSKVNQVTGERPYRDSFKKSHYFKRINDLINDVKLLDTAETMGYKIVFFPHPNIRQQMKDFNINQKVEVPDYNTSYQKLFNESSILITDYSSVAFDFAYLKKPVIYYQFDENHLEKGYFDYNTMGFGEVINDHEILIQLIIQYLKENCEMKEEYVNRVNAFYAYSDKDNCKRVFQVLKES
ncbi:CDP-glycerol glycerophosphotransferase family protein [Paenibacillus sp. FSL K6-2441]|uniref:bifunctional glycosyltransferase/CDP-glycerol:glycerophosphate glycerophosphotransferase n=1 Tax=Paenibacillus sp. FSL K6-2441 TaxID=2954679 RepID=UPI0030D78C5B